MLQVERKPESKWIFFNPNIYDIQQQIDAIYNLQSKPRKEHLPLLKLFVSKKGVIWPKFNNVKIKEWFLLKESNFPGVQNQRNFVEIALSTPDFTILEGPPGFFLKIFTDFFTVKKRKRKELINNLERFQAILLQSKNVHKQQSLKRNEFSEYLQEVYANEPDIKEENYKGYNDLFRKLHNLYSEKELEKFTLIRTFTKENMRRENQRILDWLNEGHLIKLRSIANPKIEIFLDLTQKLRDHLNDWFVIFQGLFMNDITFSLVYSADEFALGEVFPHDIDNELEKVILILKKKIG